jgi:hypothetical protein
MITMQKVPAVANFTLQGAGFYGTSTAKRRAYDSKRGGKL